MTSNIYQENYNFNETRNEVVTYDWRDAVVMYKFFNQLSLNVVLNKCKYRGNEELFKETKQIHQRHTLRPMNPVELSNDYKQKSI